MSSRRRTRRNRIIVTAAALALALGLTGTVVTAALNAAAPSATATEGTFTAKPITKPFVPNLLVIGDSYTGGSDMGGTGEDGWPALVRKSIVAESGRLQLNLVDRGGAGYVNKGQINETFGESYHRNAFRGQDVAVVYGSINDSQQDAKRVGAAARALYADIRKNSPKAALIVIAPAWPGPETPENMHLIKAELQAAAVEFKATFVDGETWFRGDAHAMIGADGTHPNNEGHKYLAKLLLPSIKQAVAKAAAAHK
jgi:lysophospholipase L1-like esterase